MIPLRDVVLQHALLAEKPLYTIVLSAEIFEYFLVAWLYQELLETVSSCGMDSLTTGDEFLQSRSMQRILIYYAAINRIRRLQ